MDKLRVYQVASLLLLIANIGLAVMLFWGPHGGGHPGQKGRNILHLTEQQQAYFRQNQQQHKRAIDEISQQQKEILHDWFQQLKANDAPKNPGVPPEVSQLEREKIQKTYAHLYYVKGLLADDQLSRYPEFMDQNLRRILAGPPPPRRNKHDR